MLEKMFRWALAVMLLMLPAACSRKAGPPASHPKHAAKSAHAAGHAAKSAAQNAAKNTPSGKPAAPSTVRKAAASGDAYQRPRGFKLMMLFNHLREQEKGWPRVYSAEQIREHEAFQQAIEAGLRGVQAPKRTTETVYSTSAENAAYPIRFIKKGGKWAPQPKKIPWGSGSMTLKWCWYKGRFHLAAVRAKTLSGMREERVPVPLGYCLFGGVLVWQRP